MSVCVADNSSSSSSAVAATTTSTIDYFDNDVIERYSVFVDGLFDAKFCDYLHNFVEFKIATCKHNIAHQHESGRHYKTDALAYKTQERAVLQNKKCIYYYSPICRLLYNYSASIAAVDDDDEQLLHELELMRNSTNIVSIADLSMQIFPKLSRFIDSCCELISRHSTHLHEVIIFDLNIFDEISSSGACFDLILYLISILCLISQNNHFPFMQIYMIMAANNNAISDMTFRLLSDYDSSMIFRCKGTSDESKISIFDRLKHYIHIIHVKFKF